MTAKKNIQKHQSQLTAFLPFSLTPSLSLRSLRNCYNWTSPPIPIHVHILRPRKHVSGYAETEYLIFASTRIRCNVSSLDSPPPPPVSVVHTNSPNPSDPKKNPFWRAVSKICSFGVRIHWFQGNAFYVACLRQDCFVGYKSYNQNREENCDVTLPW